MGRGHESALMVRGRRTAAGHHRPNAGAPTRRHRWSPSIERSCGGPIPPARSPRSRSRGSREEVSSTVSWIPYRGFDRGLPKIPVGPQISALIAADPQKSDLDHLFALQIAW